MEHFLLQLFIFLAAAAIAVPVAKKFGLGSVLGYLIAGIIIGPFGLSLIGEVEEVMHFTEFGVVDQTVEAQLARITEELT